MATADMAAARAICVIDSDPPGAAVIYDAVRVGFTPHRLEVDGRARSVTIAKPGFEPQSAEVVPGGRVSVTLVPEGGGGPDPGHSSRTRGWDD